MSEAVYRAFAEQLARPDDELELDRLALLIAQVFQPDLDVEAYLHRLDLMGEHAAVRLADVIGARQTILALNQYLFEDERFQGNSESYYDPRNSFLNEVLERRTGIPITLSLLYMEVARRVGFVVEGVGLPGHFLVRHPGPEGILYFDPFDRGRFLTAHDCEQKLQAMFGKGAECDPRWLEALPPRRILSRMLSNLKGVYVHAQEPTAVVKVLELTVRLDPNNLDDLKSRGLLYLQLECFGKARADFELYLQLEPDAPDRSRIQGYLTVARDQLMRMN